MAEMFARLFSATFYACIGYYLLVTLYCLVLSVYGFFEDRSRKRQDEYEDYDVFAVSSFTVPVSVVMPLRNEEGWAAECVHSILQQQYPQFELIIVDDGSTDRTPVILHELLDLETLTTPYTDRFHSGNIRGLCRSRRFPQVTVLSKESGQKKAGALNAGLNLVRYQYVCVVDGDTVFERDALLKAMVHVHKDPEHVLGIGSYYGLSNGFTIKHGRVLQKQFVRRPLIAYQDLEYVRTFIGNRIAWSRANAMPTIGGSFAIWRRDMLQDVGGFDPAFSSEDLEMTFRAHDWIVKQRHARHRIVMLPYYAAWTEGPSTVRDLLQQRNRWHRVTLETVVAYRHMLFNPRYGSFGWLTVPYFVFYEVLGLVFETASLLLTLTGWLLGLVSLRLFVGVLLFIFLFQALLSLIPLFVFNRDHKLFTTRAFAYFTLLTLFECAGYHWLIMAARIGGTIDYFRGVRLFDQVAKRGSSV